MHVQACLHLHISTDTSLPVYVCIYPNVCVYNIDGYIYTHMCVCMLRQIKFSVHDYRHLPLQIHRYVYTYAHTYTRMTSRFTFTMYVYALFVYRYTHTSIYIYIYIYIYIISCVRVHTHAHPLETASQLRGRSFACLFSRNTIKHEFAIRSMLETTFEERVVQQTCSTAILDCGIPVLSFVEGTFGNRSNLLFRADPDMCDSGLRQQHIPKEA